MATDYACRLAADVDFVRQVEETHRNLDSLTGITRDEFYDRYLRGD